MFAPVLVPLFATSGCQHTLACLEVVLSLFIFHLFTSVFVFLFTLFLQNRSLFVRHRRVGVGGVCGVGGGRRGWKKAEGAEGDVNFRASGTEPRGQTKQRKGTCHITYLRAAQSHEPKQNKGRAPVTEFSCERNRATNPNKTKEGQDNKNTTLCLLLTCFQCCMYICDTCV